MTQTNCIKLRERKKIICPYITIKVRGFLITPIFDNIFSIKGIETRIKLEERCMIFGSYV